MRNGISAASLSELANEVKQAPGEARMRYGVGLCWQQATRAEVHARSMLVGPHRVNREFTWEVDEPRQLLGTNHAPNPQEHLLSGLGGCIMISYVVAASVMCVQLDSLQVEIEAELDLSGFLGIGDPEGAPYRRIDYRITVSGDATPGQYETLREQAIAHSPNAQTIGRAVPLNGRLEVVDHERTPAD